MFRNHRSWHSRSEQAPFHPLSSGSWKVLIRNQLSNAAKSPCYKMGKNQILRNASLGLYNNLRQVFSKGWFYRAVCVKTRVRVLRMTQFLDFALVTANIDENFPIFWVGDEESLTFHSRHHENTFSTPWYACSCTFFVIQQITRIPFIKATCGREILLGADRRHNAHPCYTEV